MSILGNTNCRPLWRQFSFHIVGHHLAILAFGHFCLSISLLRLPDLTPQRVESGSKPVQEGNSCLAIILRAVCGRNSWR